MNHETITLRELASGEAPGKMRATVFRGSAFEVHPLPAEGRIAVGRGQVADIVIDDASISRVHAILTVDARGNLEVEDAGSSNGTMVRGRRLEEGERVSVMMGEAIDLGQAMLVVHGPVAASVRPRRLWSHGDFEARLEEECARASASGGTFTLARLQTPDIPASQVEMVLFDIVRPYDCIAKYARGDYELLFVDSDRERSLGVLDAIRERLDLPPEQACAAVFPEDARAPEELAECAATGHIAERITERVVVEDPSMVQLYQLINRVASSSISVLLLGETGTGKEVLAEAVHSRSSRCGRPFVRLNCAAMSDTLLESELFGHEKGAFTGADRVKPGLLETADKGTVFLDELGELSESAQAKLLRVLENRRVRRVGGIEEREVDVRFVAATNRDLESAVEEGRFRSDLFYRLAGITLLVPPLRERPAELQALSTMFAEQFLRRSGRPAKPSFSDEASSLLRRYRWPGNIRELRNTIERAVLLSEDGHIEPAHLPQSKLAALLVQAPPRSNSHVVALDPSWSPSELAERQHIVDTLEACAGNQTRAAKKLGISRRTLVYRLERYRIPRPQKR